MSDISLKKLLLILILISGCLAAQTDPNQSKNDRSTEYSKKAESEFNSGKGNAEALERERKRRKSEGDFPVTILSWSAVNGPVLNRYVISVIQVGDSFYSISCEGSALFASQCPALPPGKYTGSWHPFGIQIFYTNTKGKAAKALYQITAAAKPSG